MKFKSKIKPYPLASGGWDSLKSTVRFIFDSKKVLNNIRNLMRMNKPHGFNCPGCAWGNDNKSTFNFCENGAKAVAWESTRRAVTPDFFIKNSVNFLYQQSDYFLEYQGRIIHPMRYNIKTDHYEPITWDNAFKIISQHIKAMDYPDQMELYTSGRASNEVSWLYQMFGRLVGTNNFPDCSNMCHEASSIALKRSIGVGKSTICLDDFKHADAIFIFGQNVGTNHPRMLHSLRKAINRGAKIITFNTLRERGLEYFSNPQKLLEIITPMSTTISFTYYQPKLGGDMAALRGIVKVLLEIHRSKLISDGKGIFNQEFIENYTQGIKSYLKVVDNTSWDHILYQSGLSKKQIIDAAIIYQKAKRVIITWAMGITQHKHSIDTIREIVNLQLLFGHIGKKGAGVCPVRGHSNVQGNRTMGINEKPTKAFLDALSSYFNFNPPRKYGHNTIQALNAMLNNQVKVFISLGGNLAAAAPDSPRAEKGLRNCDLTVYISTKLNRSHLVPGKECIILPTLGRTERDLQATGNQYITVEDTFSMIHPSKGISIPLSDTQRSEISIISNIAHYTIGNDQINWLALADNYNLIRDQIAAIVPGFTDFNKKCNTSNSFYLGNQAAELNFNTSSGKAEFSSATLPKSLFPQLGNKVIPFVLQTIRSHDQYNTTIYGLDDRYRGIYGQRNVLFINKKDIHSLGFSEGQLVDIETVWNDGITRSVKAFKLVPYNIPRGNIAAYYPETNPLVPLSSYGDDSGTPTSKSIPVKLSLTNY
ncbi:FdhF/YdeP family oxidoreductase [Pantoea sp. Aalb]|uniref:FdhF/YdeP family oxidoreductase n=1 Tax=Pantoea sp. Aalb TaxID=2576762 RepID=UPI00132B89BB|nr:FdhF/YdeP family oxidoreductase [Pantoea sp. Aalb]MXP67403.1 FdhF/YdeP family oxidoreductase [Pantoea sp. Aalb]